MRKKYNIIEIKSLSPEYHDATSLLPHAMFQILIDFVENECGEDCPVNWNAKKQRKKARAKMDELIKWWKEEWLPFESTESWAVNEHNQSTCEECLKVEESLTKSPLSVLACSKYHALMAKDIKTEERMEKELSAKLKELINIRNYLWT
jgi:hypothetical protein